MKFLWKSPHFYQNELIFNIKLLKIIPKLIENIFQDFKNLVSFYGAFWKILTLENWVRICNSITSNLSRISSESTPETEIVSIGKWREMTLTWKLFDSHSKRSQMQNWAWKYIPSWKVIVPAAIFGLVKGEKATPTVTWLFYLAIGRMTTRKQNIVFRTSSACV